MASGSVDGLVCLFDLREKGEDDAMTQTLNAESSVVRHDSQFCFSFLAVWIIKNVVFILYHFAWFRLVISRPPEWRRIWLLFVILPYIQFALLT
jgi:hypothetical protein